jgi:phage tail sheath protein FI
MAEYLSPGVYIEEIQGPQPIQAVGTSTGAFVGITQSGPVNSAQLITNYTQFANTFGNFLPTGFLAYAVQNFFGEGGTRCYVVRAFKNKQQPSPAVPYPDVATANVTTTGVSTDPIAIVVQANSPGTWGSSLSVRVLADTFDPKNTPAAQVNAAGMGYKVGDALTLSGGSGGTITVNAVSTSGAIQTFSLTTAGTGYPAATLAVTGGSGKDATLTNSPAIVTLNTAGAGYKAGDVLTLVQTGASGATVTVNSVSGAGAVLTFMLSAGGTGYTTGTGLNVTGGNGTGATFNYSPLTLTLNVAGTGYKANDVLTLVGPSDRTITVNSVSGAGGVVTSTLTNPGVGYSTATAVAASGGSGTGATFDYTVNPNQEFQIQVWQTPQGSTLAALVETYTHVSMIEADANGIPNPNHIEQRINGISKYIFVMHASTEPSSNPPPAPQTVLLAGGTDGLPLGPTSTAAAMHAADFIGSVATATTPATGLHAFDTVDDINIVAIPDLMLSALPAVEGRNSTLQAINYCGLRKDCFYVADPPSGQTPQSVLDYKRGTGTTFSGNAFNSKYAALYYPWISIADPLTGGTKLAPPSGAMAGRYSATDVARGVFKAPAGVIDGFINSASNIERITSQGEQDTLNPEGVNVIRKFADAGIVVWGARTVSADPEWTYVPVRRLVTSIEQSILRGTQGVVFEPNDPALWKRIIRDVSAFLRLEWLSGALFGDKAEQAFFVKCDAETNPPESIALGRVVTKIGIAPVKPAEFVIFQIQLTAAGGSVSE